MPKFQVSLHLELDDLFKVDAHSREDLQKVLGEKWWQRGHLADLISDNEGIVTLSIIELHSSANADAVVTPNGLEWL